MPPQLDWSNQIDLLDIRVFENPAAWSWRSPSRQHYNLWIALLGEGLFQRNDQSIPFRPGSIFLIHPLDSINAVSTGKIPLTNFAAHFLVDQNTVIPPHFFQSPPSFPLPSHNWISPFCRFLSQAFYLDRKSNQPLLLQGINLLIHTLQHAHHQKKREPIDNKLLHIVERMRQNPAANYALDDLAAEMNLSPSQFSRRFKAFTGQSPLNFAIDQRIAFAESLLRDTDLSIEAIASRLGYRDVYFFSRQFRRFRGFPPSSLRKMK